MLHQLRVIRVLPQPALVALYSGGEILLKLVHVPNLQPNVCGRAGRGGVVDDGLEALERLLVLLELLVDVAEAEEDLVLPLAVWVHLEHPAESVFGMVV